MVHVGIDIGTTNTVVSYVDNGALVTHEIDDSVLVPSVVYIDEHAGRTTVGQAAVDEWADPESNPACSFRRWKLHMVDDLTLGQLALGGGKRKTAITPEYLTTRLIERIVEKITEGDDGLSVESAVVTVPHGWRRERPERCAATRKSAAAAKVGRRSLKVQPLTLSEPVAAASYWLWEARRSRPDFDELFAGRTILVVDIGGGTFDLSLARVGESEAPLVVVDAINNDIAGDYVTALVLGRATERANTEFGVGFPTDAQELLRHLASGESPWVRNWFLTAQGVVRAMSLKIAQAVKLGRKVVPHSQSFDLPDGGAVTLRLTREDFEGTLQPFYEAGRALVGQFLTRQSDADLPYAVVFAGGGSRIAGIRDLILRPALEGRVDDPAATLNRILMNDARVDQAISRGAALVATGLIRVEERLLCDIGLGLTAGPNLTQALGIGDTPQDIVVSPMLARHAKLPVTADSKKMIGDILAVLPGTTFEFKVVVFDDPQYPWVQERKLSHPADGLRVKATVVLTADADGLLTCNVHTAVGRGHVIRGRTTRERLGPATLAADIGDDGSSARVFTPEQIQQAVKKARGAQ